MTNNLTKDEKKAGVTLVAALVAAGVFVFTSLITGMAIGLAWREKQATDDRQLSRYLLVDAAAGLKSTSSALRLCRQEEVGEKLAERALVYVTRAETALELSGEDSHDAEEKEAFLNDLSALLQGEPKGYLDAADEVYKLSSSFYDSAEGGGAFSYGGELASVEDGETEDPTEAGEAESTVARILMTDRLRLIGTYDGKNEFWIEKDGLKGYAIEKGGKVCEFSFEHGSSTDYGLDDRTTAMLTAERCGYGGLTVNTVSETPMGKLVTMCMEIDGALCRDECASAVVTGGRTVAFTAGRSGRGHKLPKVKVSEESARAEAPYGFIGEGRLVTTFDGVRDRVCYEYRYESEDGEHYVYVCAENGKQMEVR